ncbi:MAG: tetratricopeptide repeat protein [Bacteroidia bacterium]
MRTLCIIASLILFPAISHACSMYKITKNGKTIVGNNEDWISPNAQFWVEKGEDGKYGVIYVGLIDNFAQGALNDAGLVFDGFSEPYLAINNTEGKVKMPISEAVRTVMQDYATVEEVEQYLKTIDLSSMVSGQLVFVDKSGTYLIVEGDEFISGDESEKSFSNFYYSQIASTDEVELDYYQSGLEYLASSKAKRSFDYCGEVMKSFASPKEYTQYSTIYDLEKLTIRVYLFHDFSTYKELDLKQELAKGNHTMMIPALFPKDSKGYQHYQAYNNPENPTWFLENMLKDAKVTETEMMEQGFNTVVNMIGYEWLFDKKDPTNAITIFTYGTDLMPNDPNLHNGLGDAYLEAKAYDNAIKSFARSLVLNPDNEHAIKMLSKISELKQKKGISD